MAKSTYVLDKNDPEYKDWVLAQQRLLFVDDQGKYTYQYHHSFPASSDGNGEWFHVFVPIHNPDGSLGMNVKSSPGWNPVQDDTYRKNKATKFADLPRNQLDHIQLTNFHFNYITSVSSDFSRTDYLLAFKVEQDYPTVGLLAGYYLIDTGKNIIGIAELRSFFDCEQFIAYAINNMRFVLT